MWRSFLLSVWRHQCVLVHVSPEVDVYVERGGLEFRDDQSVISPALCGMHNLSYENILLIRFPGDVVFEMLVLRSRMHPGGFVSIWLTIYCIGDQQVMHDTGLQE